MALAAIDADTGDGSSKSQRGKTIMLISMLAPLLAFSGSLVVCQEVSRQAMGIYCFWRVDSNMDLRQVEQLTRRHVDLMIGHPDESASVYFFELGLRIVFDPEGRVSHKRFSNGFLRLNSP
jgi:hypothetical protein